MKQKLEKPSKININWMRITNKKEMKGKNSNSTTNNKSGIKWNETKTWNTTKEHEKRLKSKKITNKREIKEKNFIFRPNNKSGTKWNETNIWITVGNWFQIKEKNKRNKI